MNEKYLLLASEVTEIESILEMIPKENVIERMAFESRLSEVKAELEKTPSVRTVEKAKITFRGNPVLGSRGVLANFGAKAMSTFSEAFACAMAHVDNGGVLKDDGRLPDIGKNQLYITGTATGSFGFELEIPYRKNIENTPDAVDTMMSILELFEASALGTDDDVAQLVEDMPQRAVNKVNDFLLYLASNQAWFGFQLGEKAFKYNDVEQLKSSAERLHEENREEKEISLSGEFSGVLPHSRTFEFKPVAENLIKGKIDNSIEDPDLINRYWLHKPTNVTLQYMRLGQGRPRYTLKELPKEEIIDNKD